MLLRLKCWWWDICYKHKIPKVGNEITFCPQCHAERISKRNRQYEKKSKEILDQLYNA